MLKVDVQGFECEVFDGLRGLFRGGTIKKIHFEVWGCVWLVYGYHTTAHATGAFVQARHSLSSVVWWSLDDRNPYVSAGVGGGPRGSEL